MARGSGYSNQWGDEPWGALPGGQMVHVPKKRNRDYPAKLAPGAAGPPPMRRGQYAGPQRGTPAHEQLKRKMQYHKTMLAAAQQGLSRGGTVFVRSHVRKGHPVAGYTRKAR